MNPFRAALFGVLLVASLGILAANARERHRQAAVAGEPLEAANADLAARIAIANLRGHSLPPTDPLAHGALQAALQRYRAVLRTHPDSEVIQRRIGILLGAVEGPDAAWQWFRSRPAGADPALWRAAYAPGTLSQTELDTALARLDRRGFAWYGELVRARLYRKAGADGEARETLARLQQRLRPSAMAALFFFTLALFAVPLGGGIWVALLLLRRRRHLAPPDRPRPFASVEWRVLAEAFVLWFFGIVAGGWGLRQLLASLDLPRQGLPVAATVALLLLTQLVAAGAGGALLAAGLRRRDSAETVESVAAEAEPAAAETVESVAAEAEPAAVEPRSVPREAAYGVAAYLAAIPLLILASGILSRLLPDAPNPPNPAMTLALQAQGFWDWLLLFVVVVVAAPLFEEVFFRGALYGAIRRRAGAGAAIAVTSAFFALVHPQLPLGFFPILALGIVFALAVELRRSLIPCIVAHMLNNGVALLLLALARTP